ncbi:hypothetical protein ALDI51_17060 [Alicycliphilus denitrificans]|uniref:hypothetical protein n=1 Tax=Alicycliphilus denitrificans TaxID=179636 RepID=UPI000A5B78F3|nr:hypothetical protein [Alicycliphilus denitrificans]MBN9574184.1 hypothetical protein [Alicycliphilus denitrificans]BCN38387.1 hypothetical protein ALDI51_17060 [Alicycliphilus denitrificans]
MANNIQFITSINRQTDFEDIVRPVAKFIYGAEAYLVGGPYDGGLDLIYKAAGREIKEAVQITIQEKNLETKILEDAKKNKKACRRAWLSRAFDNFLVAHTEQQ